MAEVLKMSQDELVQEFKKQVAMQNVQILLSKINIICFKECVMKPEFSLNRSEEKCVSMCVDRYVETVNLISKSYVERLMDKS